ncbi:alpha/beta fold hydrolase [Streptomyces sp. NPDC059862]|uniref:alpha/beta fold hydrolase n=1 Tax=unclassified Streptomyces TaxID=2593676 RepID=UPI0036391510
MTPDATVRPTLLLVHGAWHGSWCWDKLQAGLGVEAIETRTVDLPSAGGRSGIAEDTRVVREAVAALTLPPSSSTPVRVFPGSTVTPFPRIRTKCKRFGTTRSPCSMGTCPVPRLRGLLSDCCRRA